MIARLLNRIEIFKLENLQKKLRKQFVKMTDSRIESVDRSLNNTYNLIHGGIQHKDENLANVSNALAFSLLTYGELTILTEKMSISNRKFEELLYARLASILIIGYLRDINSIIGADLVPKLKEHNFIIESQQLLDINKQFSLIKNKNDLFLSNLRNKTSAHKLKDAVELLDKIESIDKNKIIDIITQIIVVSDKLHEVSNDLIGKIIDDLGSRL